MRQSIEVSNEQELSRDLFMFIGKGEVFEESWRNQPRYNRSTLKLKMHDDITSLKVLPYALSVKQLPVQEWSNCHELFANV